MDCSIQSTFGRSASAVEVNGHCVTPEEIVTRYGIENDFDDILVTVFEQLGLRPEEIDAEWFGSGASEFHPICASTQVAKAPREIPDVSCAVTEGSKNLENAFDFDVDSFMPSGFDTFNEQLVKKPKKAKSITSENILGVSGSKDDAVGSSREIFAHISKSESIDVGINRNEVSNFISPKKNSIKAFSFKKSGGISRSEVRIESNEKISYDSFKNHSSKESVHFGDNDKASETVRSTSTASSQPSSELESRIKSKLLRFVFVDDAAKSVTSPSKENRNEAAPSPKRAKPKESKKDLLNLQNLAPEDWNFGSIDVDFDF